MLTTAVFAKDKNFPKITRVITPAELKGDITKEFGLNPDLATMALEIKEGSTFPLHYLVNHKLFSIAINPNATLKANKTCYLRIYKKKVYVSEDLNSWDRGSKYLGRESFNIKIEDNPTSVLLELNLAPAPEPTDDFDEDYANY